MALLAGALATGSARADPPAMGPPGLLMDTAGQGPALHVTGFRVDPDAGRRAGEGQDSAIGRSIMAAARLDDPRWHAAWIHEDTVNTVMHGWEATLVGADTAILGIGAFTALETVETIVMGLSAALSFGKFAWHVSQGETLEALSTAAVGTISFASQYYGYRALQLGSVAAAIVDVTLNTFGTEAHEQRFQATRSVYNRYYAQRGRSVNDWKLLSYRLLENRSGPEAFTSALNDEVARYVRLAWDDPYFYELMAGAGSDVAGLTRFSALPVTLRTRVEGEHRQTLLATLQADVLPELAHRAWLLMLADLAHTANMDLRPLLNEVWEITLEPQGLTEPARFTLHLPAGGGWSGKLEPDSPRLLRMTTLAFMRAGGPQRITLELPEGPQSRQVIWHDRRARVVFGLPLVGQVAGFELIEGPGRCEVTRRLPDGQIEHSQATSPAPPTGRLDIGSGVDGSMVLGRFSEQNGWSEDAQVFRPEGLALRAAAPMTDGLLQIEACDYGLLQGDRLLAGQCQTTRLESRAERLDPSPETPAGAVRLPPMLYTELRCTHDSEMNLTDIFMLESEGWTRFPMDGEAGRILLDALRQGMERGFTLQ